MSAAQRKAPAQKLLHPTQRTNAQESINDCVGHKLTSPTSAVLTAYIPTGTPLRSCGKLLSRVHLMRMEGRIEAFEILRKYANDACTRAVNLGDEKERDRYDKRQKQ